MTKPKELEGVPAIEYAEKYLRKVRVDNRLWEIEYIDGATGQRWVMDYPQSELQGGGPPRLRPVDR